MNHTMRPREREASRAKRGRNPIRSFVRCNTRSFFTYFKFSLEKLLKHIYFAFEFYNFNNSAQHISVICG